MTTRTVQLSLNEITTIVIALHRSVMNIQADNLHEDQKKAMLALQEKLVIACKEPVITTCEPTKIKEDKPVVSETPKPKKEYPPLTDAQKQAILMSLHHMCSCDGDMARELNGVGFSKMDTTIGHSLNNWAKSHGELTEKQYKLALMLLKKYKNQIAIEDYTCIYGDQQNEKNKHLAALAVRDANSERNENAKTAPRTNGERSKRDDKRSKQA